MSKRGRGKAKPVVEEEIEIPVDASGRWVPPTEPEATNTGLKYPHLYEKWNVDPELQALAESMPTERAARNVIRRVAKRNAGQFGIGQPFDGATENTYNYYINHG